MGERLLLKPNVQAEPMVDQWYAWPHLIAPATWARNITDRHMKIMDSYIAAPGVHAQAVKNPKLLGGPFIDYQGKRADEIKDLRERTAKQRQQLIVLSQALGTLDELLKQANGAGLPALYSRIPDALKGYVELAYDLRNSSMYRLIEPLLYASEYYDESAQSLMLSITHNDGRSFALSTPRLENPGCVHLRVPLRDERLDFLFKATKTPIPYGEIADAFNVNGTDSATFRSFFASDPPRQEPAYSGDGVRWRYFGHACVLIETRGVSILTDPALSYEYESSIPRYTYRDLPDSIDFVLITHGHQDHILFESLLQLRHKIKHLVVPQNPSGALQDPSLKLMFKKLGFRSVVTLGECDEIEIPGGAITGLPFLGEHCDLSIGSKLAYMVRAAGKTLVFAADSCNLEPLVYRRLAKMIGKVDLLFLGMECEGAPMSWLYGPLISRRIDRVMDESRRLNGSNFDQAISIVDELDCREVYVYAMGQEPWLKYVLSLEYKPDSLPITESNRLVEECRRRGIVSERLFGQKERMVS